MKTFNKKSKGVVKGAPSGFVISLLIHAAAFMLAGLFVVFTVVQKEEKKFVPPKPVDRPKMKLKKPQVKVKKSAKPKATTRIVTKVQKANMPDIQLPEMSGISDGLVGDIGGFEFMPDLSELASPFGETISTGNDLKGQFYNMNRGRDGQPIPMTSDQMEALLHSYFASGWRQSKLSRYYRSPNTIYATTICVPTVMSQLAPEAFGEQDSEGWCWAVLYEGELVYPEDITFRFWGVGDKLMAVNVDGETVLICAYNSSRRIEFADIWQSKDPNDNVYYFGEHRARPSDWITLKAGEPKSIKVLMSDIEGGLVYHMLSVEVQGEEYPRTRAGGGPTFPVFRTAEIPVATMDRIYSDLYPGDTTLTNGPIFRDYVAKQVEKAAPQPQPEPEPLRILEKEEVEQMRIWTGTDGRTFDARLRTVMGGMAVLESPQGKQVKVPWDSLSSEDQDFISLNRPPKFEINFQNSSVQIMNPEQPPWSDGTQRPLQTFNYTFGVQVSPKSLASQYDFPVTVEYHAIGEEVDGNNFVLLERNQQTFNPADYNRKTFSFKGQPVRLRRMAYRSTAPVRGTRYSGYVVTITDKRGVIIDYDASNEFLFENYANLKNLTVNTHFNRECKRVIPARPTEDSRGSGATSGN